MRTLKCIYVILQTDFIQRFISFDIDIKDQRQTILRGTLLALLREDFSLFIIYFHISFIRARKSECHLPFIVIVTSDYHKHFRASKCSSLCECL